MKYSNLQTFLEKLPGTMVQKLKKYELNAILAHLRYFFYVLITQVKGIITIEFNAPELVN